MKIKKALACILAVAMVISLMPAMAFAATENTVKQVQKVAADDTFQAELGLKVKDFDMQTGSFDITINNAEWADTTAPVATTGSASALGGVTVAAVSCASQASIAVSTLSADDNSMRINLTAGAPKIDETLILALNLKATGDSGDVTVTLSDNGALISGGTYTVATIGNGGTVASVIGSTIKKVSADGEYTANAVKISETSINSVNTSAQGIRLTLPKKYTWKTASMASIITGDMLKTPITTVAELTTSAIVDDSTPAGIYWRSISDNVVDVYFIANRNTDASELLKITPIFTVDSEAPTGDVTLSITNLKGQISAAEDLVVAQNIVESIEVKSIAKLPTIQNGLINQNGKTTPHYVYVVLKENVAGALTPNKSVKFTFPEEVQIVGSVGIANVKKADKDSNYTWQSAGTPKPTATKDASSFTWTSNLHSQNSPIEFTFRFPVSVEAGFTGDIEATVSGAKAGIDEQTVVVGTAVNAVEVEAATTEIKAGIQKQALSDIIIKETDKGMLLESNEVKLVLSDIDGLKTSDAKIEVIEGDIEVDEKLDSTNGFTVKAKSTKASTIKISGLAISPSRVPAEGPYDLKISGGAIVDNGAYNAGDFKDYAAKIAGYVNVVTPADSTTVSEKVDAKFVIGEASYTNNGEATEMDAAAYIDSHNRTMVPIRYVANACGISENDIRWEQNTQTAIINGLNTVVTVKMGSNKLQTSTGEITMDTVAVNNNGRIYVPVRYIANALGANVSWDAATKTVTLTK